MTDATASSEEGKAQEKKKSAFRAIFTNRKTVLMTLFGFSSGLPFALLVGTLFGWLAQAEIDLKTIGLLSWIGLAYSFKFLWSPIVDRVKLPGLEVLGRRRSWLLLCQVVLTLVLFGLAATDPVSNIGWFALIAVIGAFASATQDIVIDGWRIDVADKDAPVEILSSVYQLGNRTAALVGGAIALMLAQRMGWPMVYAIMAGMMLLTPVVTFAAMDTPRPSETLAESRLRSPGAIDPKARAAALCIVLAGWAWAIYQIVHYMVVVLTWVSGEPEPISANDFTKTMGPWIVAATVILPTIVAATLNWMQARGQHVLSAATPITSSGRVADHVYTALVSPLAEMVGRLKWSIILVLALVLTYRLTDAIWGPFALPFYLKELQYTNDEVAFASKIFGIIMTIAGVGLAGFMFYWVGRMPTLLVGAITAALTNFLYADLATGGTGIDAFANALGLNALGGSFGVDPRMVRLMIAISGENIAGGIAGAAFVGYMSTIVAKEYSAIQYALLSSLTVLVGSLGRAAIGEAIEAMGYAPVFRFAAALGMIAVVLCVLEWFRQSRLSAHAKAAEEAGTA